MRPILTGDLLSVWIQLGNIGLVAFRKSCGSLETLLSVTGSSLRLVDRHARPNCLRTARSTAGGRFTWFSHSDYGPGSAFDWRSATWFVFASPKIELPKG